MIGAYNNGVPLIEGAPRAAITQSLIALAKALSGDGTAHAPDAGVKNGFGRLFKLWPSKRGK
jgi:Flp pilus assembly CpaE family ATPase